MGGLAGDTEDRMDRTGSSKRMATRRWAGLVLLPLLSGCAFGPRLLENSHGRYQESVKRVEDEELLRNLVRLRYTESFSNLDVASITAQYELAGVPKPAPSSWPRIPPTMASSGISPASCRTPRSAGPTARRSASSPTTAPRPSGAS